MASTLIFCLILVSLCSSLVFCVLLVQPSENTVDCTKNGKAKYMNFENLLAEPYNDTLFLLNGKNSYVFQNLKKS